MADYNSGLPVRSEADGVDEKVIVKVIDGVPGGSNQMSVDSDKNAHVEVHTNDPAGVDRVLRSSEIGALTPDGVYDASNNTKPGNVGIIASVRDAAPGDTTQTQRLTSVTNGSKRLLDVSLHDENGDAFSISNPLPVTSVDSEGTEVNDYNTASAVTAGGTSNHDYTVTGGSTLKLTQIWAAASGKMRVEVQIETGPGTNIFNTRFVAFNSTANPNIDISIKEAISVVAGARVRVIRRNLDNQSQDLYTTISGHEIA